MTSPKWDLIKQDLISWGITAAIMFGPVILASLLELLAKQDWGSYGVVASLAIGSLLKLVQKWGQTRTY